MQFCQSLPFTHPDDLLELAPVCEEAGFEGIMLADHLFAPEQYASRYPYDDSGEAPFDGTTPFPESFEMGLPGARRHIGARVDSIPTSATTRYTTHIRATHAHVAVGDDLWVNFF